MKIGDYQLGYGRRPMIVAELGASHNGNLDTALALIVAAKAAGADAIKVQAFLPDSITRNFDRPEFVIEKGPWQGRHLHGLYVQAHMPRAWFAPLFACAYNLDIPIFASVFSEEDVEFMEEFDPAAYKLSSFELVDTGLIKAAQMKRRPLILSTGMANQAEINDAMRVTASSPCIWLHCVSSYPTHMEKANLGWMEVLRRNQTFVGLSDHTLGFEVAQMATARGACLIEKHITLTPGGEGLDDGFASGPEDFAAFVQAVHRAHAALGNGDIHQPRDDSEHRNLRKSLYAVEHIAEGEMITALNVRAIRPGLGMAPKHFPSIMGAKAAMDIPRGTPIAEHMIGGVK